MPNRVLEQIPQLRRVTNMPFFRRGLSIARQHRLSSARSRFIVGELRGGTRSHRLANDTERCFVVRHRTRDMEIFDEIFRPPRVYEPPAQAAAILHELARCRPLRVLDLGGNIGLFGVYVLSEYRNVRVTSFEPEPENLRVLRRCVARNQPTEWEIVEACALTTTQDVHVTLGGFADACVSDAGAKVAGVDVLPLLGHYDYVKMDIEGSEWPILHDRRWPQAVRNVAVFVLEWHERGCDAPNPRAAAITAVESAGFVAQPSAPGWDHGLVWGWRQR